MDLLSDPLTYVNWGAAIVALYLCWRYGKELKRDADRPAAFLLKFVLLAIAVGGCLYITSRAGDIQIERYNQSKDRLIKPKPGGE